MPRGNTEVPTNDHHGANQSPKLYISYIARFERSSLGPREMNMNFWKYAWGDWRVAWAFPIYVYLYMQEEVQCSAFMTQDSHMTHSWPMYELTFTAHEGSPYVYMAHVLT